MIGQAVGNYGMDYAYGDRCMAHFDKARQQHLGSLHATKVLSPELLVHADTTAYMGPDQIREAKDVSARSDISSLGVVLHELDTSTVRIGPESAFDPQLNFFRG